jgi:hypothetical protein
MTSLHYARNGLNCLYSLAWAQYRSPTSALLDGNPTGKPDHGHRCHHTEAKRESHGKTARSAISRVSGA